MDCAFSASALFFLERTLVQSQESVCKKFCALGAEFTFGLVFFLAVVSHHRINRFFLSFYSRMLFNSCGHEGQLVLGLWTFK